MTRKYVILLLFILLSSCEKRQDENDILLKFYGDAYEDIGYSVAKVDNGYVIAGQLTAITRNGANNITGSSKKMGIIKTGSDGNVIWKNSFGDTLQAVGTKVLALDDGSIICTGYVTDQVTLQDMFVVKLDADGTNSVQKIYKSAGNQYGTDIIKTPEGFLILGSTDAERQPLTDSTGNASGKKDILLQRINSNLEPLVSPTAFGFPGNDAGAAIKADINGGYIVVGTTDRSEPGQAGNNILILRVNTNGSVTQPRILGSIEDEYAADIEVLNDGYNDGYIVAVTVGSEVPVTVQRGYILKIPVNIYAAPTFGPKIEIKSTTTTTGSFSVKAISRYRTNSFVMAGQSGTGSSAKMLIFVVDADGNLVEGKQMIAGSTGIQVAYDVISDDDDYIIAVGKNSYETNSMISLLKFRF
ncbi:MAG: hypothetical protein NT144_07885 [Bacteroidia bacterium]|nr:hypothetical protein [Bacteroidia bacterium]